MMDEDWLQKRVTVAEAEAAHAVKLEHLSPDPVPFGYLNERWQALLARMQEGDELWEFCSSPESWAHLAGREGIALVRDGKIIDSILTIMN
jgi:hypothetical protein